MKGNSESDYTNEMFISDLKKSENTFAYERYSFEMTPGKSHGLQCNFLLTLSVIIFAKIIYFVIILLSQTVVRTLSRQPFFYTVRYSFLLFYIFPGNRKTRRTEVLRVSYVWTQRYLTITNLLYMRQSHDFVVRSRAFVKCPLPNR